MVGIRKIFQYFNCLLTYFLTFFLGVTWKTDQHPQQKTRQKPTTTSSFQSVGTRKNAQNLPRSSWSSSSQWMSTLQKRSTCWRFGRGRGFGWKIRGWMGRPTLKIDGCIPLTENGGFSIARHVRNYRGVCPGCD